MRRLAVLQGVQGRPDPSIRHAGQATAPTSASSPGVAASIGIGAGLGAALGVIVAAAGLALRRRRPPDEPGLPEPAASAAAVEELVERLEERLSARESAFSARERDLQHAIEGLRAAQAEQRAAADG